jgi:hypothetical protein
MKLERIFLLVFPFLFCLNIKSGDTDRINAINERLTRVESIVFGNNTPNHLPVNVSGGQSMKKSSKQQKEEEEQQFLKRWN